MSDTTRKALITGAASGIGLGLAAHLYAQGYRVYMADLDSDAAGQAAQQLALQPGAGELIPCVLDVCDPAQASQLARELGALDVLVNNAGIQHVAPLEAFPANTWARIINVLLVGPAMVTQAFLPAMKAKNFGRIVNIGSIHSLVASPYKSAYVAAKQGLLGFSKALALETAQQNITINTLCPAYVKTPLVEKQIASQAQAHNMSEAEVIDTIMLKPMPKKSFISQAELNAALDFCISPQGRNFTGQTLVLDGGWTAQ
ncbi:3-hydroxybutyrate dehydrogenase [Simiduia sp. 21SJ11W-1]|uniref:3-hydroxybutyrate dehydrogenase n=1 Tax=Simiduia sp. 21SJ11W-1 TaxID=2909669 RepID=UPI00209DCC61|nr:3-hydroxybutyrate dehydrogenase [Simiduia sp. 21SJ11W-1]UTA47606.1 3-hydroxybutyrate dehydrogenase [Simiduia sp. 21SJ11W-1]